MGFLPVLLVLAFTPGNVAAQPAPTDERESAETRAETIEPGRSVASDARSVDDGIIEGDHPQPENTGRHCLGESRTKWVLHQLGVALVNPTGAENTFRLGLCTPFIQTPGILFDFTSIEAGINQQISPTYVHLGGYVQLTPLSIIQLRVELNGVGIWPLKAFDRAGYFELSGYDAQFDPDTLVSDLAEGAFGWNLSIYGTLRARVGLGPTFALILLSQASVEYWSVGEGDFYFNLRREVIARKNDWIFANDALFGLSFPVTPDLRLRVGGYDSIRYVFESGYFSHQVGGFVMAYWPTPGGIVRELSPFLRVGVHTDHDFREGTVAGLAGVLVSYDLGPL
ncbi:MAG: hypothetical protein AAGF12_17560 [Myxococcota bacterium]